MSRVLVAMSGGVDSSVAAALLVDTGHEVVGVTMKTFCYSGTPAHSKTCCGLDGIMDAKRVADALGIPHYVFDVEEDFTRDVIDDFVSEYAQGRTPNPCVNCNSNTKFKDLLTRGRALGCDQIASGHYVRVEHAPEGSSLLRGLDPDKDQSYFLWAMPRSLLPKLLFPVGELTKSAVRAHARDLALIAADKPVALVCHAPGVLRHVKAQDGRPLVEGKRVTGFTNTEEEGVGLTDVVPFLVEEELKAKGGDYSSGPDWGPYVLEDGLLITGQNPASSAPAAKALLKALEAAG